MLLMIARDTPGAIRQSISDGSVIAISPSATLGQKCNPGPNGDLFLLLPSYGTGRGRWSCFHQSLGVRPFMQPEHLEQSRQDDQQSQDGAGKRHFGTSVDRTGVEDHLDLLILTSWHLDATQQVVYLDEIIITLAIQIELPSLGWGVVDF